MDIKLTGERVIPNLMGLDDRTYQEHFARYRFAQSLITGKVLDAACGSGYGTQMLGADGLDVSAEAVEYARKKYEVNAEVYNFETGLPDGFWDTIVSFETIEHLENPECFLIDVSQRSKQFIFSIPLNNPSQFHKQVYTLEQAQKLIYRHFNKVKWYEQTGTAIGELKSGNPTFLVGVASNQERPVADLVLISHNSQSDLEVLLPSIEKHTENYTLTIVDNGDQALTIPNDEIIHVENKGYGSACNVGAKTTSSEFVVFMNCDLEVSEGWLDELLLPFNDERVVITGARLFREDGEEYPTPEKDMAIGCVFAVRRTFFEQVNGFDEKYFLFFEETDLCKRAKLCGLRVVRSEAKVIHFKPHFLSDINANPFLKKCWDESKEYFDNKFKKTKKCLIGMPCGSGLVSAYAVDGLFKMTRPCQVSLLIIERQSVDMARNYLIEMAIKLGVDYLFFVDDDGVLPADCLEKMIADDKDIVGAPMMTRNIRDNGQHALCVFEKYDFYIGDGRTVNKYRSIQSFDNSTGYLHSVDAIGGACMLIKRECFEALYVKHNGKPFEFANEIHETKEHGVTVRNISEDILFSERAKQEGFEIFVDTRIRPVHLGKPKFIRFEQADETLTPLTEPKRGAVTLSETLKNN